MALQETVKKSGSFRGLFTWALIKIRILFSLMTKILLFIRFESYNIGKETKMLICYLIYAAGYNHLNLAVCKT